MNPKIVKELFEVLEDLDALLKHPDASESLAEQGVNISLALTASAGLRAYLSGNKAEAAEEFATVAEEVSARLACKRDLMS